MATAATNRSEGTKDKGDKPPRERRQAPALHERMKNQLTTAALRQRVSIEELENLEGHIGKLKGLLSE